MAKLGYLLPFVLTAPLFIGYALGGAWNWLTVAVTFMMVPVIDALVGLDQQNREEVTDDASAVERDVFLRIVPLAWVPLQLTVVGWALWTAATQTHSVHELIAFTVSLGVITGGFGITIAHELGHRRHRGEQAAAHVLLATVSHLHFFVEHNRGHHRHVATPRDPATARYGQSFWPYLLETTWRQWHSAWQIEHKRCQKRGLSGLHNRVYWYAATTALIPATIALFSPLAALIFICQSVVAVTLLELVNYVEHYGLVRREIAPGRYEKVKPIHSWNASHRITNYLLFKLQRHADHHANATRHYESLRHFDEAPQLPAGYPTMVLAAMVPPLWHAIMNPRVEAWRSEWATQATENAPEGTCPTA